MRADRLLALLLLLQARGRTTAAALAEELEVSVRTIYRDLEALGIAGVPVFTESGPGGGCELLPGYRSPLDGLTVEEANALLILGVPAPLRELGLETTLTAAQRRVKSATPRRSAASDSLVHLDMPRWFHHREAAPGLATMARAVQESRRVKLAYAAAGKAKARQRIVDPLGLVNKAGVWYLVAGTPKGNSVFRASRILNVALTDESFVRPREFDLAKIWDEWSAEFAASRPRLEVMVKASPQALRIFPEILGDSVRAALDAAGPEDEHGWRRVVLTFEHVGAAAYRLSGFSDLLEVLEPKQVRDAVVDYARRTLSLYRLEASPPPRAGTRTREAG